MEKDKHTQGQGTDPGANAEPRAVSADDTPVRLSSPGLSPIWLVPIIALLAAGWLSYRAWQESGPTIDILFAKASGIAVGKTEIRYKDVRIGVVSDIRLDKALDKVWISAEMNPEVVYHLSDNTRFWVVEPRVSLSGVSGLNTLFSGVYIGIDPGSPGPFKDSFVGLDEPPSVRSTDVGTPFRLFARSLGSLDIGSPVYYRQIRVGEVTGYSLAEDGASIEVKVFIDAPYDQLVGITSRFWNISGFGMELNAQGLKASMASVASLISGGIAFKTPGSGEKIARAGAEHRFNLFTDEQSVAEEAYTIRYDYLMNFRGSVRGLEVGAPVEYRGIKVGEVADIRFVNGNEYIQVLATLEPQRLDFSIEPSREELDQALRARVESGMRAQLKTGNLLTGSLYVDLAVQPETPGQWLTQGRYPEIPTTEAPYEQLSRQLNEVLGKLNQFPLEKIGGELLASLSNLRSMSDSLQQQRFAAKVSNTMGHLETASADLKPLLQSASQALGQLDGTLKSLDNTLAPVSDLQYQSLKLIDQLSRAANAFRLLAEELNRNPEALLFGKERQ